MLASKRQPVIRAWVEGKPAYIKTMPLQQMSTQNNEDQEKVRVVKRNIPVITKEQMKVEMLEHDYFDTEILYHGMKNTRTDDHKRSEKDLIDEQ